MKNTIFKRLSAVFLSFCIVLTTVFTTTLSAFAEVSSAAIPVPNDKIYISSYIADTAAKTVTLTVVDERIVFDSRANYGEPRINNVGGNFEASSPLTTWTSASAVDVSDASGTSYKGVKYDIKFSNVQVTGEGNTLSFEVSYPSSTASIASQTLSQAINESFSIKKSEPLPTAKAYVSNYQVVDAAGNALAKVKPGDKVIVAVTIIDERINGDEFGIAGGSQTSRIHTIMDQGSFTIPSSSNVTAKVRNSVSVKGTDGTYPALCYTLEFRDVTYVGGSQDFGFGISYTDHVSGNPNSDNNVPMPYPYSSFTVKVTQATDDVPAPNVILNSANYGKVAIIGEKFTLATVATNTSENLDLENVSIKIDLPTGITLSSGNSQVLIGKVGKKGTISHSFNLIAEGVANDITSLPVKITYTFEAFVGGKRTSFTSVQDISINVQQPTRFSVQSTDLSQEMYIGQEGYLNANLVNKGKTTVYNVTAEIISKDLTGAQVEFVGNVAPGATADAEFNFSGAAVGTAKGQLVITYEDASGTQTKITSDFTVNVLEETKFDPQPDTNIPTDVVPQSGLMSKLPYIIVAIIVIVIAVVVFLRKRKKKKQQELEDEDENI